MTIGPETTLEELTHNSTSSMAANTPLGQVTLGKPPTESIENPAEEELKSPTVITKGKNAKEDKEVANILTENRKKIRVNTQGVFVDVDRCHLPKGFISKPTVKEEDRKRLLVEKQLANSCYKRRMTYDDKHKEHGGNRVPMPTQ